MKLSRYIGKEDTFIQPNKYNSKFILLCKEGVTSGSDTLLLQDKPAFWFIYNDDLYYGIIDYSMEFFENYFDWFEDFPITDVEFYTDFEHPIKKTKHKNVYYKVDYKGILNSDEKNLDEFSENELDLIKKYYRLHKINSI